MPFYTSMQTVNLLFTEEIIGWRHQSIINGLILAWLTETIIILA